jgi:RimJ/RimL family protein N-acetyltransferase
VADAFETERLALRAIRLDDVDLLVALDADPAVMRYISGGVPSSRDDVEGTVRRALGHRWVAYERATGEFVGWFSLRPTGEHERELGYRLRREAWGRGLATEGAKAMLELAFGELGVERVWAQTMAVNRASRRVMERCGLRYVRTFHGEWADPIPGTEQGEVEYELLRADVAS